MLSRSMTATCISSRRSLAENADWSTITPVGPHENHACLIVATLIARRIRIVITDNYELQYNSQDNGETFKRVE